MERRLLDPRYKIITLFPVLSNAECENLIDLAEEKGFTDAPITTLRGFVMRPDIRNNTRIMYDDHALVAELWNRIQNEIPDTQNEWEAIGLNERLRFYRYEAGQAFRWHYDGSFRRSSNEESLLTFMVYLNQDCIGGATEFDGGLAVQPRTGMGILFLHHVLHQGAEISSGLKYVLRSDVMYRRKRA